MSLSEEDVPLIYGLEFQARALVSEKAPTEVTRFMVGTQTLKMASNQIHIVELNDETGALYSQVYSHPCGEIWHLDWSPHDSLLLVSTYQMVTGEESLVMEGTIWRINGDQLEKQTTLNIPPDAGQLKTVSFHPSDATKLASVAENKLTVWDIGNGALKSGSSLSTQPKEHGLTASKWNPEEKVYQLVSLQGTSITEWDTRQSKPSWKIDGCHLDLVRDIDFNRNRSSVFASCGDDGCLKYWDVRCHGKGPLAVFTPHQHWVTSVRINSTHDQLVITSSTDCTVCLSGASSVASDPVLCGSADLGDSIIKVYQHHEDSVTCVEWSPVDPWTFASLSHDGRLLTSTVPNVHKYKILGI